MTTGDSADGRTATRGRRRSERSRRAVLAAAEHLYARDGWPALTIEAIAHEAGVAKATIYRWWPSKAAVLMEAMVAATDEPADFPDTGDALEDVRVQLRSVIAYYTETATGDGLLTLIAESRHDPALAAALAENFIASRRATAREVLRRGQARGELRADLDPDLAIDAIYGAVYYRFLVSQAPTTSEYADRLLDELAPALRPPPAAAG